MQQSEIDALLRATVEDDRLSGAESKALDACLREIAANPETIAFFRHRVFEIAAERLVDPKGKRLLHWLEAVLKRIEKLDRSESFAPREAHAYFSSKDDCPGRIADWIRRSEQSIDVCVFTITDDRICEPLLEAHRRGIPIRIITDDDKSCDVGSDVHRIREAGMEVRTDRTKKHMHHKFAIFDQLRLLTGSYNWTRGAAEHNLENFILTEDPRLVREFQREFDKLWKSFG